MLWRNRLMQINISAIYYSVCRTAYALIGVYRRPNHPAYINSKEHQVEWVHPTSSHYQGGQTYYSRG